jgi:hypothetical protein
MHHLFIGLSTMYLPQKLIQEVSSLPVVSPEIMAQMSELSDLTELLSESGAISTFRLISSSRCRDIRASSAEIATGPAGTRLLSAVELSDAFEALGICCERSLLL